MSVKPVLALTKPLEKHVLPEPRSPSSTNTSPPFVPTESTAPTSSMSSTVAISNSKYSVL